MLLAAAFVIAQAGSTVWTAARPAECAPLAAQTASNVWERAKYSSLRRYCDLLAAGAAKLANGASGGSEAREAIANAEEASRALPGHAAPLVLRGRALVSLGQFQEGVSAMEAAEALDPHALVDPAALFAWSRALGRVGRSADARVAFRALLPVTGALAPAERGRAEIEAALLAQARGPDGLAEAIPLFRQARRDAQDALQSLAGFALSLALDRAGEREESRVPGAGKQDPRETLNDARVREALADAGVGGEADALAAFALEGRDPAAARELWASYLAGPGGKGPWADHARTVAQRAHGK
jgi:tetratricopeptide (TPR) repeat protein